MKNYSSRLLKFATYILIAMFGVGLIFYSHEISGSVSASLVLCATTIIPALFPFFVISSLCVSTNLAYYIGRALDSPMRRVFGLPGALASAFTLGLIGGYPLGAKTVALLYDGGLCTKSDAERALMFCCNCGPSFIFGIAGGAIFGSAAVGLVLYIIHAVSAVILGIVFAKKTAGRQICAIISHNAPPKMNFGKSLTLAVSQSASSIIGVCAFVVFFSAAIKLISCTMPLSPQISGIVFGMLEMTTGVLAAGEMAISVPAKMAIISFFIAFGGFSVHCQTLSVLADSALNTRKYFIGKALHACLSAALTLLVCFMMNL